MPKPVTAVIVGAGHRAMVYSSYAKQRPDRLKIVGVADLQAERRERVGELYEIPPERRFETAEELARQPLFADAIINGTMDHQHVATSVPLLDAGYHMLLEKPFATDENEMWELVRAARRNKRSVSICHVLRYAPFYAAIRQAVIDDEIGEIINLQTVEHVSYHHMAVGFVRGKWANSDYSKSSMLMAKCCHDLDLIMWMKSGVAPTWVSSFGSNMQFRPEKAPDRAGTRCLVDCPIESDCLYSARKHYLDHPKRWAFYVWDALENLPSVETSDREKLLRSDSPYGRCVWRSNNNVVDHQSLVIEFEDGSTATHNMVGGTSRPSRSIHLIGTRGEIQGVLEESAFVIRHIDTRPGHEYSEDRVDLNVGGDAHGAFGGHAGGDLRLVEDFVSVVEGEQTSISSTPLEDSIRGHLVGFRADASMAKREAVEMPSLAKEGGTDR